MIKIKLAAEKGFPQATVNAVRLGWFAIHHKGNYQEDFAPELWRVTHVQTGRLVGWFFTASAAKEFADFLNSVPVDWRRMYGKKTVKRLLPKKIRREIFHRLHAEKIPRSHVFCYYTSHL